MYESAAGHIFIYLIEGRKTSNRHQYFVIAGMGHSKQECHSIGGTGDRCPPRRLFLGLYAPLPPPPPILQDIITYHFLSADDFTPHPLNFSDSKSRSMKH